MSSEFADGLYDYCFCFGGAEILKGPVTICINASNWGERFQLFVDCNFASPFSLIKYPSISRTASLAFYDTWIDSILSPFWKVLKSASANVQYIKSNDTIPRHRA